LILHLNLDKPNADKPQPKKINTEKTEQTERAMLEKFSLTLYLCLLCFLGVENFYYFCKHSTCNRLK